jgi:hypothetical protein
VLSYYRLNTGFFLLLVLFGFGVMRGYDHWILATFFVSDEYNLVYPILLLLLYQVKTIFFIKRRSHLKENEFLNTSILFPIRLKVTLIVNVIFLVNAPAFVYLVFIAIAGFLLNQISSGIIIIISILISQITFTALALFILGRIPYEKKYSPFFYQMNRFSSRRMSMVFAEWLIRKEPVLLLLTKLLSAGILIFSLSVYNNGNLDQRFLNFALLSAFTVSGFITPNYIKFDALALLWRRNFPQSLTNRFFFQSLAILPLLIPELLIVINGSLPEFSIIQKCTMFLYGFSYTMLLLNLQWTRHYGLTILAVRIFWFYILYTFLILFGLHELIIMAINLSLAYGFIRFYYFRYEYIPDQAN